MHFLKSTWKKTKKAVAKVYNFVRENVATFVGTESYQTSKVDEVLEKLYWLTYNLAYKIYEKRIDGKGIPTNTKRYVFNN